jgi:hypothetical protein
MWRFAPGRSDLEVVFVVGAPRSGTTLMQQVLVGHGDFFSIPGESGIFTHQDVFDPARKHFGLDLGLRRELFRVSRSHVEFFERAVRSLPGALPGKVFVEKTPQHALRTAFLLDRFPRSRVVHVVRDGRDCFCSSQANQHVPQRASVHRFASYWRRCINAVESQSASDRVLRIRYEDFVADPQLWLGRLMAFLGKSPDPRQLDPGELGRDPRSRLDEFRRLGEAISPSSVEQWKRRMEARDIAVFRRVAGRELERMGSPA